MTSGGNAVTGCVTGSFLSLMLSLNRAYYIKLAKKLQISSFLMQRKHQKNYELRWSITVEDYLDNFFFYVNFDLSIKRGNTPACV